MKGTELQRRTPLQRKSWFRSRSPISRISPAKRRDIGIGKSARAAVIERDRHCILCSEPISDVHHRLPRGAGGAAHDPTRWSLSRLIGLCRSHHRWIEEHRTEAIRAGLLIRHGLTSPRDVPVRYRGLWALLDDKGDVHYVMPAWRPA